MAIDATRYAVVSKAVHGDTTAIATFDRTLGAARTANDFAAIDAELAPIVAAAADGDERALEFLLRCIDRHRLTQPAIRKLLVDEGDVEDAMQTTLLAVTRAIGSFEQRSRFTTWLYKVAEREALQVLRRNRRVTVPEGDRFSGLVEEVRRFSSVVASADAIHNALNAIDPRLREAVVLRDLQGLDYASIAEELNIPINTVKTRIRRGRQQVAERIVQETA